MSYDPQSRYLRHTLSQHPALKQGDAAFKERGFQMVKLDATSQLIPAVVATLNFDSPGKLNKYSRLSNASVGSNGTQSFSPIRNRGGNHSTAVDTNYGAPGGQEVMKTAAY